MKRLHALLVLTLVAGIGHSQCAGGLFAVPQASAARANMNMEAHGRTSPGGCGDGTSCLEQIHRRFAQGIANMDGFGSGVAPDLLHAAPPTVTAVIAYETGLHRALAGPLFSSAVTAARTIVKRE